MRTILILYMPVLHQGYIKLLEKYRSANCLYLLGSELVSELAEHVEIRELDPAIALKVIAPLGMIPEIRILDSSELKVIRRRKEMFRIVVANEAITRKLVERYLPDVEVTFEPTSLRWEESNVLSLTDVSFDRISTDEIDRNYLKEAQEEASQKSSDWWRRVGVVLVTQTGLELKSYNQHVPTEYTPYINGDPRDSIEAGTKSDFSSALHSEKAVFAQALRAGISTEGADLYTTVFPCPDCAKLIAYSGIKQLFFKTGHASLDGAEILKVKGVKIIKVE